MIHKLLQSEQRLLIWIQEHMRRTWLTILMKTVTFLGNGGILWIFIAVCFMLRPKYRFIGSALLLSLLLSIICINLLLKNLVARARPHDRIQTLQLLIRRPQDFSFPSGHTSSSFAAAAVLFFAPPPWLGISALCIAVLIACSRLYLGAHFPSDVISGAIIGVFLGVTAVYLLWHLLNASWIPVVVTKWFSIS